MAVVYSIRDWNDHFEVSQSRKVDGPMTWVALPTKHDGKGFRRIMAMEDGAAIYGAWCLIVGVAAKCPRRGILADKDGPLDAEDLAMKTGCQQGTFTRALNVLSGQKIGWVLVDDWEETGSELPLQDSTVQDSTGQDICGELAEPASPPPVLVFPCVGSGAKEWCLTEAKLAQYRESFPGVDVLRECRAARQWCLDNVQRRKTFTGMPAFLSRWLTTAQNRQSPASAVEANAKRPPSSRKIAEDRYYAAQSVINRCRREHKTESETESELIAAGFDPKEAFASMPKL